MVQDPYLMNDAKDVATRTHGTPDPALPSPSLSINPRFASVSLTRVHTLSTHSSTARHSPSYPSHGCPPRVRAYPGRGSRVNTNRQKLNKQDGRKSSPRGEAAKINVGQTSPETLPTFDRPIARMNERMN
ncbi:hypothetical protein ALC53_00948 [Atta colombica]|uniref:Uncharacterized protein n=1 Tax=Atta colombica TaxID=520822 RepID=A0A195BV84_9HYME|nr:hypothetical protein ALC53_00948 [Atta colombica]